MVCNWKMPFARPGASVRVDLDLSDRGPHAGILTPRKVRTASNIAKLPNLLKRTFMMHRTR
jgi:hypothetical protein